MVSSCDPNPCQHNGVCTEASYTKYTCNCNGTHHRGKNCELGIINIQGLPVFSVSQITGPFMISAHPNNSITITFITTPSVVINPSIIIFDKYTTDASFTIEGTKSGKFLLDLQLSGPDADWFIQPGLQWILVVNYTAPHTINQYFTRIGEQIGSLVPGSCSSSDLYYQCPFTSSSIMFSSSCSWSQAASGMAYTNGIVFINAPNISLPLSISGAKLIFDSNKVQSTLPSDYNPCTSCNMNDSLSNYYHFTPHDIADLLNTRAIATTYLKQSSRLMPMWLQILLGSEELTQFFPSDYNTFLALGNEIKLIDGCDGLTVASDALYSALQLYHNLTVQIGSNLISYSPTVNDGPICFAVNLCSGLSSPVHIKIPQGLQEAFSSLDQFNKWNLRLKISETVVFNENVSPVLMLPVNQFWNGSIRVDPVIPKFDLRLRMSMTNELVSDDYKVKFEFTGLMYHQSAPAGMEVSIIPFNLL